jgi:starch synthase
VTATTSGSGADILLASSEVVGFSKTGGLADVAGALPRALAARGHRCTVFTPLYSCARQSKLPLEPTDYTFTLPVGGRGVYGRLWRSQLPDSDVTVYLVEQPDFFERDNPAQGRGLYHYTLPNGQKRDYPDNCARFVFFCRAILESFQRLDYWPDIVHCNDWQTGLLPVYLRDLYPRHPDFGEKYTRVRTMFTIHNIAYQGIFWHWDVPLTGLEWRLFNHRQLEFYGHLNLLKSGIVFSDILTTVSPRYAQEIQTSYFGCGLEGVLSEHRDRLFGIVNGVDYAIWNPAIDPHIAARYDANSVGQGKPVCKTALQHRYRLAEEPKAPLLGMVSRLVDQKGLNLVGKSADALLRDGAQMVFLGEGDPAYHRMLQELRDRFPERVGLTLGFDESLAHLIEAGADIFLMPSLFEPSGLSQLYSLKYGTVPVVRATGGLADTITDCTPETLKAGTATGFSFVAQTPAAFQEAVLRAIKMYRDDPVQWLTLMRLGMGQDWSWHRSATEYERLYAKVRYKATQPDRLS